MCVCTYKHRVRNQRRIFATTILDAQYVSAKRLDVGWGGGVCEWQERVGVGIGVGVVRWQAQKRYGSHESEKAKVDTEE